MAKHEEKYLQILGNRLAINGKLEALSSSTTYRVQPFYYYTLSREALSITQADCSQPGRPAQSVQFWLNKLTAHRCLLFCTHFVNIRLGSLLNKIRI